MNAPGADAELGRLAREALTSARQATLLIADIGDVDCDVALFELDGRPQFACGADSPVATADGCVAQLHVPLGCARGGGTVRFAGRLTLTASRDGESIVELVPTSVTVQRGHEEHPHDVPVEAYLAGTGDAITELAARLLSHTNDAHAEHLREFAARQLGAGPETVAAASLADLDADGVDLHWIDADGFHRRRLSFARPAATTQELAAFLRDQLHARTSHTHDRGDQ